MPGSRPVCHIQHHIIIIPVPAKYRETQVIAYLGQDPKQSQLKNLPLLPGTEVLFLPSRPEEVSLVVIIFYSIRGNPKKAVID
jgi:hypothetical protein